MNAYLDVVCYRSKILADGTSPIMLRLTKDGKRKYISLHLSANQSQWDFKKNTPKRNCPDRDAILNVIERKSRQYREQITQFTFSCICEFGFQIRWKLNCRRLSLDIPVLILYKIGMDLAVALPVYR